MTHYYSNLKKVTLFALILIFGVTTVNAQEHEKVERPEEVKGNRINQFVKESFDIYDSTFTINEKINLINIDLDEYEKSLKDIKSDASMAAEGVKSGDDNAKESTAAEIKKRNLILGKIERSTGVLEKTMIKLKDQAVKLTTESPATLQTSVKQVPVNMKAAKTLKKVKNNSKVSIQVLKLSKTELVTQTKRLKELKERIAGLKKK